METEGCSKVTLMSRFPDCSAHGEAAGVAFRHRIAIKPRGRSNLTLAVRSCVWMASYLFQRQHWASISRVLSHTQVPGEELQISPGRHTPLCPLLTGSCLAAGCSSGSQHTDKGISVREPELLKGNCWLSQAQLALTRTLRQPP